MSGVAFRYVVLGVGLVFAAFFFAYVLPPVLADGDIVGAFAAGFVNPFASGYSLDTILCGVILAIWIVHEQRSRKTHYAWACLPLIIAPGVATAFGLYLFLRSRTVPAGASS
ncbi:DUF2834 domain-containing protein [bacterium]|nr:DUF2834 domain-containing protein [bacterium]